MENKPRTRSDLESEFCYSFGIISSLSDLMTSLQFDRFEELDKRVIDQANFAIFGEAQKLPSLFYELLENRIQTK